MYHPLVVSAVVACGYFLLQLELQKNRRPLFVWAESESSIRDQLSNLYCLSKSANLNCHPSGTNLSSILAWDDERCNKSDQEPIHRCPCKKNYFGDNCDTCEDGFQIKFKKNTLANLRQQSPAKQPGFPPKITRAHSRDFSCLPCNCDMIGSKSFVCDKRNGGCNCNIGYMGSKCDKCSLGYRVLNLNTSVITSIPGSKSHNSSMCIECGECFNNWLNLLELLKDSGISLIKRSHELSQAATTKVDFGSENIIDSRPLNSGNESSFDLQELDNKIGIIGERVLANKQSSDKLKLLADELDFAVVYLNTTKFELEKQENKSQAFKYRLGLLIYRLSSVQDDFVGKLETQVRKNYLPTNSADSKTIETNLEIIKELAGRTHSLLAEAEREQSQYVLVSDPIINDLSVELSEFTRIETDLFNATQEVYNRMLSALETSKISNWLVEFMTPELELYLAERGGRNANLKLTRRSISKADELIASLDQVAINITKIENNERLIEDNIASIGLVMRKVEQKKELALGELANLAQSLDGLIVQIPDLSVEINRQTALLMQVGPQLLENRTIAHFEDLLSHERSFDRLKEDFFGRKRMLTRIEKETNELFDSIQLMRTNTSELADAILIELTELTGELGDTQYNRVLNASTTEESLLKHLELTALELQSNDLLLDRLQERLLKIEMDVEEKEVSSERLAQQHTKERVYSRKENEPLARELSDAHAKFDSYFASKERQQVSGGLEGEKAGASAASKETRGRVLRFAADFEMVAGQLLGALDETAGLSEEFASNERFFSQQQQTLETLHKQLDQTIEDMERSHNQYDQRCL